MDTTEIRSALERLRGELASLAREDTETRAHLESLIDDIESKLENPEDEDQDEGLIDRLRDAIETFETTHPRATRILNDIMMTLSNLGI